jgi:16S rRNA G527 N7-methylase RsmG
MDATTDAFLELLFKWNRAHRITAFADKAEALSLGVVPSLAALEHVPERGRLLDVGSGGGFPAVPLLMALPGLTGTLCEPSRAKAAFLREVLVHFGLNGRVEPHTAEEVLAREEGPWDAVTVRGVHLRHGLLRRLIGALAPGGVLVIWSAGERAHLYGSWLRALGLSTEERQLSGTDLVLLLVRVPRGTSENG